VEMQSNSGGLLKLTSTYLPEQERACYSTLFDTKLIKDFLS
jgi:hypothetical protein